MRKGITNILDQPAVAIGVSSLEPLEHFVGLMSLRIENRHLEGGNLGILVDESTQSSVGRRLIITSFQCHRDGKSRQIPSCSR